MATCQWPCAIPSRFLFSSFQLIFILIRNNFHVPWEKSPIPSTQENLHFDWKREYALLQRDADCCVDSVDCRQTQSLRCHLSSCAAHNFSPEALVQPSCCELYQALASPKSKLAFTSDPISIISCVIMLRAHISPRTLVSMDFRFGPGSRSVPLPRCSHTPGT